MLKKTIFVAFVIILGGCGILFRTAPERFPQFSERQIAGPGVYQIPQWSPDSRYLAFLDSSRDQRLMVYDSETQASWEVVPQLSGVHFTWDTNSHLLYLKYRLDLSGSPYPTISDLHQVGLNGENDTVIAPGLSGAGDFVWFGDGERAAILLTEPTSHTYFNDVYMLNTTTGTPELWLESEALDFQYIASIALSPDEKMLLLYGVHEDQGQHEAQVVIYDLESQTILDRLIPGQIIPTGNMTYPVPGIGDSTNYDWVGGQRWYLTKIITPGGACYNYALFFFDIQDTDNSFCIPSVIGVFGDPTISPDLTKISYVTVVGPGEDYLMIGEVTSDLLAKLELGSD